MRVLVLHQNFPGQFGHLVLAWSRRPGWDVRAIGRDTAPGLPGFDRLTRYKPARAPHAHQHPYLRTMEAATLHGQAVARMLLAMKHRGFTPDAVLAHPGWGESLYVKDVFPDARLVHFCEWYYQADGADLGFDPEFPITFDDRARVRTWNALHALNVTHCDAAVTPTQWQKSRHPEIFHPKITVQHEGIDTESLAPDPLAAIRTPDGTVLKAGDPVVTYVIDNANDLVVEAGNEGIDLVQSSVTHVLSANVENLTLTGTTSINGTGNALDNVLTGNSGNNNLSGGTGNDTLDGGVGNDTLRGGLGDDNYVVTMGDLVVEGSGAGTDTVQAGVTWTIANTANVENLTLTGSSAINATGNALDNVLTGNSAANVLTGDAGNDTYAGGAGNDTLNDTSTTSNDVYRWGVGHGNDVISDAGGSADRIEIAAGVTASQISLTRATNDLQVRISGATDVLTVKNWYVGTANRIEEIRLADGTIINTGTAAPASLASGTAAALMWSASRVSAPMAGFAGMNDDRGARLLVQALSAFGRAGESGVPEHHRARIPLPVDLFTGY